MTVVCQENHAHMIKTDGGLWHGPANMIIELEKIGWRQVVNPKRDYYFEHDKTHPSYVEKEQIGLEDNTEVLEVEVI